MIATVARAARAAASFVSKPNNSAQSGDERGPSRPVFQPRVAFPRVVFPRVVFLSRLLMDRMFRKDPEVLIPFGRSPTPIQGENGGRKPVQ